MLPIYDINKIKFTTDKATFQRGIGLYEKGKVTRVEEVFDGFRAVVIGTKPYHVSVSGRRYNDFNCTCYLGENGTLCKHVVALALHAVMNGRPLSSDDKRQVHEVKCSGRIDVLSKDELATVRKSISESIKYIKPYTGPSRTWFANQSSLKEGCNRLSTIVSNLPVNKQVAEVIVKLLLRLDKKLQIDGVDDSNGIVGEFMNETVRMLEEFARIDQACINAFQSLAGIKTCFGWEEPLVRILEKGDKHNR